MQEQPKASRENQCHGPPMKETPRPREVKRGTKQLRAARATAEGTRDAAHEAPLLQKESKQGSQARPTREPKTRNAEQS